MLTNNYIKMCEQAEEIQDRWRKPFKSYIGDLYWQGEEYLMIPEACIYVTEIMFNPKDEHIWLPTQEQLQDMIFGKYTGIQTITSAIEQFSKSKTGCDISIIGEMNELWLAFVYHEKWNKVWTGEKWVKADD